MNTAWLLLNVTVCSGGKKLRRILRHGFFQLDLEFKIRNRQVCVTMFDPWEASWITALYIWCGRSLLKKNRMRNGSVSPSGMCPDCGQVRRVNKKSWFSQVLRIRSTTPRNPMIMAAGRIAKGNSGTLDAGFLDQAG
jgi:hypothetical protein